MTARDILVVVGGAVGLATGLVGFTAGCGPADFCVESTALVYAPADGRLDAIGDDYFTRPDTTTATGLRIVLRPGENITIDTRIATFEQMFVDLSTLDGFGTTADLYLRFDAPVDIDSFTAADALVLLPLFDDAEPVPVEVELRLLAESADDDAATVIISPLRPLRAATTYGLALTTRARDATGSCIAPSPAMRDKLAGDAADPNFARTDADYARLVELLVDRGSIGSVFELSAALTFTTQSTTRASEEIAKAIRRWPVTYRASGPCVPIDGHRLCEGVINTWDFRDAQGRIDDREPVAWQPRLMAVSIYLPSAGTGPYRAPYPTILYGHGLGGTRHQAGVLARFAAPRGIATIAIDAVLHGDHPEQPELAGNIGTIMEFFGLSLSFDPPLDGLRLRDNFRQSTYDKLQLIEALRPGIDADGDYQIDVGIENLVYLGVSLGGIMAPELLALTQEIGAAVLIVPGAKTASIIEQGTMFGFLVDLFRGSASDGEVARFFPLLQTLIDRGDPAAYAPYVLERRLPGFAARTPHLLVEMVLDDEIVPNASNLACARALGVPLVAEVLLPAPGFAYQTSMPVAGNYGGVTAGLFQYDVILIDDGPDTEVATHNNIGDSSVSIDQAFHFVQSYLDHGVAEIVDPYRRLGVKP